jgi:hypothetical protein
MVGSWVGVGRVVGATLPPSSEQPGSPSGVVWTRRAAARLDLVEPPREEGRFFYLGGRRARQRGEVRSSCRLQRCRVAAAGLVVRPSERRASRAGQWGSAGPPGQPSAAAAALKTRPSESSGRQGRGPAERSSSSRSGSPSESVRRRPAGPQGPAERSSSSRSGSPCVRRRPAGPQGPDERSSSSRSGSPSVRRRPAGPQGPAEQGSSSRSNLRLRVRSELMVPKRERGAHVSRVLYCAVHAAGGS